MASKFTFHIEDMEAHIPAASGVVTVRSANPDSGLGRFPVFRCVRRPCPNKNAYKCTPDDAVALARLSNYRLWDAQSEIARLRKRYESDSEAAA